MSNVKKQWLQRFEVCKLSTDKTLGVFGKGCSITLPNGQEVAIMARDVQTLSDLFDILVPDLNQTFDADLVYDVVYMQSKHVGLLDDEL